jgi:hypothetical protein
MKNVNLRKTAALILSIFLVIFFSSCSDEELVTKAPELDLNEPIEIETPAPGNDWTYDESKYFAYHELENKSDLQIYMEPDIGCPDNIILYMSGEGIDTLYGYADLELKTLSQPVNRLPVPFRDGICLIADGYGEVRIVNKNFAELQEQFRNLAIDGNDIYYIDYYNQTLKYTVIRDVDPDEFLVPVTISNGRTSLTGFKTLSDYRDKTLKSDEGFIVEPIYISAHHYRDGMCVVLKEVSEGKFKYGFMDIRGNLVIDYIYDGAQGFSEGFATITIEEGEEKTGLSPGEYIIDKENNIIAGPFVRCSLFKEGFCRVFYGQTGEGTFIDVNGNRISEKNYTWTQDFRDGRAMVFSASGVKFIDTDGKELTDKVFSEARNFSEGYSAVKDMNGLWGYINEEGLWFREPQYSSAGSFYKGFALVNERAGIGGYLMDTDGNRYLEELGLFEITCFNEEGYAIGSRKYVEDGQMKMKYFLIQLLR